MVNCVLRFCCCCCCCCCCCYFRHVKGPPPTTPSIIPTYLPWDLWDDGHADWRAPLMDRPSEAIGKRVTGRDVHCQGGAEGTQGRRNRSWCFRSAAHIKTHVAQTDCPTNRQGSPDVSVLDWSMCVRYLRRYCVGLPIKSTQRGIGATDQETRQRER
ncbi:hypothetical protein IWX90DRAFT_430741 [Phyllosticta citrichinensis]|uniref:Secreted protein n=1 Tax=Phyllosticta citrichinensis TaxID=1130410 RepID=A0ABR1XWF9_9PEZI